MSARSEADNPRCWPAQTSEDDQAAVVVRRFGGPEVLELTTAEMPHPASGEVLIKVEAAAANFADVQRRRGGYVDTPELPYIPGRDAVGVVVAGGGSAARLLGKRVAAFTRTGTYAQYAVAPTVLTFPVPQGLPSEVAAACLTPLTAALDLVRLARLRRNDSVLILAAAGGVGAMLVQVVARRGPHRLIGAVGSQAKVAYARTIGCSVVLEYESAHFGEQVLEMTEGGASVVFDAVGGADFTDRVRELLRPNGRVILFGSAAGRPAPPDLGELIANSKGLLGYNAAVVRRDHPEVARRTALTALRLLNERKIKPPPIRRFVFQEARSAHELLETRRTVGRLVLMPKDVSA